MVDSGGTTSNLVNRGEWENFEEENGQVFNSDHCAEISAGLKAASKFTEHNDSISEQKSFHLQRESSLHRENGVTGTEFKENLDEGSGNFKESPGVISNRGQFNDESVDAGNSRETDTDRKNDTAVNDRKSASPPNKVTQNASSQPSNLYKEKTDGAGLELNGENSNLHSSKAAAASSESKEIADNKITVSSSAWTKFEESQDNNLSSKDEAVKGEKTEHLVKTKDENHTRLPLKSTTSNMAAFDSRKATATTNITPNNMSVTEVKTNSTSTKQATIASKALNAENGMKSAVPIVENNSAHANLSSIPHQQSRETANQGKVDPGKNWISFGEDGNSKDSQQQPHSSVSAAENGVGGLATLRRDPLGNDFKSLQVTESEVDTKKKSTSVMPPVSFTVAELDLLASKSWMKFGDSSKSADNQMQQCSSSSAVNSQSWVTFGDSTTQVEQRLELLELDVSGNQTKVSHVPSPNPFINALPSSGSNPFQPATTNPFQADNGPAAVSSPDPTLNLVPVPGMEGMPMAASGLVVNNSTVVLSADKNSDFVAVQDQAVGKAIVAHSHKQKPTKKSEEPFLEEKLVTSGSWSMLLRFPDKKRKFGSREWKPVVIKLEGTTLQIFEEYELSAPFREIPLQAYFVFTEPKLQSFEHGAKVHTMKLEYIKYTETRSLRHRGTVEHIAQGTPIIKIASPCHVVIRELLEAFNNSLRLLPSYRDRGITYRHDEVFVDIDDVANIILSGDGTILRKSAKVLIKLRAFLTGDPECQLVLNDIVVREREEARLRGELKPQRVHHWVKLRCCDFHKCVNATAFEQSHAITFHPLDACTFELMRFPVDHHKPLPLLVKTILKIQSEQKVELKAEIQVCQETKMAKYVRNNVVFRFPIPESWVPLFRTGKVFRGEKSIKSSKGPRAAGIKSRLKHSKCSIAVSLGRAMYEPEYGSIVWRIDHLPFIHSKIPADAPHTLSVVLDLPPGMDFPENYKPMAELEYDVSYVLMSDTNVIAVKVSNQNIPDKWVCYRALYHYDVNIDISRPSTGPVRDVGCTQQ